MQDLPSLLQSFGIDLKKTGKSYKCRCYTHADNDPSMSVYQDDNDKWWAHCHVCPDTHHDLIATYMHFTGCDFKTADHDLQTGICKKGKKSGTITESPPVEKGNIWQHSIPPENSIPDMEFKHIGKPVKVWTYRNPDCVIVGYVARYENNGKKEYRPFSFGTMSDNLSPTWQSKSWSTPRPIYNADKLSNSTGQIVIVEGEKAADAAEKLFPASITCITWPGGSGGVRHADWSALKGRNAILIPDADPSGIAAMEWLAKHLLGDIKALSVSVIDTSDQPLGWDLADALDEGWDTAQTIAWAKEHKNVATLEPVDTQAAKQAAIERAISMEKKTPENLHIVPPLETTSIEIEPIPVRTGNVVSLQAQRLELSPFMPPEFSEVALARSWSETFGKNWCYTSAWNQWTQWDGTRWVVDKRNAITHVTSDAMVAAANWQSAQNLSVGQRRSLCAKRNIANVLSIAGADPRHATIPDDWDNNQWVLGTPGGIVDLRTGDIRTATHEDRVTKFTACTPKSGDKPYWDMVIARLCDGDANLYDYYKRWCGYLLTGDTSEESMLFCLGVGQSGKTKFIMALHEILADYAATADIEMFMESKIQRHTEEIAALYGARMVHCTEPESGARWKESLIKKMTGREIIQARRLYQSQFTFMPQFKLVIGANFRPALKSVGVEITRRLHVLQFPPTIPMEDRIIDLDKKLREEYPAILAWMIEGCLEWQKHGLGKPSHVQVAVAQYMEAEDTIGEWIDEHVDIVDGHRELVGAVYSCYQKVIDGGGEHALGKKRFIQTVEDRGWRRVKSNGQRYFVNVKLRHEQREPKSGWNDR